MRLTALALVALAMAASALFGQPAPADWDACAAEDDSLKRLVCYDELTAQTSSAAWKGCAGETPIARLQCYDDLAEQLSTAKWRACAETDDSLERLVCYDDLANDVSSSNLRACAETDDSLARLVCYDGLAKGTEPPPAPEPSQSRQPTQTNEPASPPDQPATTTGWQLDRNVDQTSGRTNLIATLAADKGESKIGGSALLALRCQVGELEIMASVNEQLEDGEVVLLFDEGEPRNETFYLSTDGLFVFARENQMLQFLQQLQSSRRLAIAVNSKLTDGRVAVFRLKSTETRDVLNSIRGGCPTVGGRKKTEW